eukprot:10949315-Lingulodinium_polyedra.AAC.1
MDIYFSVISGFFAEKSATEQVDNWPPTYIYCNQIPKYWVVGWLGELNKSFTVELGQAVDKSDKDALRILFEFVTGLKPLAKLPRPCLSKAVLSATLKRKADVMGN